MLVQTIMSAPAICVSPDDTIGHAAKLMTDHKISGLPVVDEDNRLIGIVSQADFLRRNELSTERTRSWFAELIAGAGKLAEEYVHSHGRKISEVMTSPVHTIAPYDDLRTAIDLMERHHVKRLPVVTQGSIIGVLSRSDFMKALQSQTSPVERSLPDQDIEVAILKEIDRQSWGRNASIRVGCANGAVTLSGTVFDDRTRRAATVVAENIPGVVAVHDELAWVDPTYGLVVGP